MSGLPVRRERHRGVGEPSYCESTTTTTRRVIEPRGQESRVARHAPMRAATALDAAPSAGFRPPTRIPSYSNMTTSSTPFPQHPPMASALRYAGPPIRSNSGMSRIPRSAIPTLVPPAPTRPPPNFTGGAIPKRLQPPRYPSGRARPKSVDPNVAPKSSSKSIFVQRKTKSGPQILTTTSSTKITEGQRRHEYIQSRIMQNPRKPRDVASAQSQRMQGAFESQHLDDDDDGEDNADDDNQSEWDHARATTSTLEQELESTLLEAAACRPKTPLVATASRKTAISPPMMMTDQGPIPVQTQVILTKSVTKQPGQPDIIGRDVATIETVSPCTAERTEVVMSRATPHHPGARSPRAKEAVILQSKIAIAPGYKQTTKTVTYEGDPEDVRHSPVMPSPQEVAKLVREEAAMIDETLALHMPGVKRVSPATYSIRKKVLGYSSDRAASGGVETTHDLCATCVETGPPEPEELSPEMIAEMMITEERGLTMGDAPATVYDYLFSSGSALDQPKIEVTSAAPFPLQDVVVPMQMPNMSMAIPNAEDVMNATMHAAASVTGNPNESTYCAIVGDAPLQTKNAARKGGKTKRKRVTLLASEPPPWGAIEDVEPVIDLVGASLAESRVVREEAEKEIDPLTEGIEFLLQMEAPEHFTQIQLRGSQKPDWFPGYMMALPDVPNLVTLARSPSEVFAAAWRATQPDIFNDDSVFII